MDVKDSSEDDDVENISGFGKFDESIEVRNAEEVKSPTNRPSTRPSTSKSDVQGSRVKDSNVQDFGNSRRTSPRSKAEIKRYIPESMGKTMEIDSEPSDSEETDDDDIQATNSAKIIEIYDPKNFEHLAVSTEVKELFQNIIRYTPQKIELSYKLMPFIPDYIPAVGDIDAFIKIPRPDGVQDNVGLTVLDEPCTNQSDPAVLYLQLRNHVKSAGAAKQTVIKRIEDAEKNSKSIEKWIEDINQLHRTKHPPAVQLSKSMPDIDSLMQQWPPLLEEKLNEVQVDLASLDCDLIGLVDLVCGLLDVPVYKDARLESLHILFTLFLEVKNVMPLNF